ncbi:MAG: hypothetical protein FJ194_13035 [Gammaproteobacteria bacterium]|nr:hypothetical protein [Gammaproteobacteria bacterium]
MLATSPRVSKTDFEAATGWAFKPEGACKGDVCIPLTPKPGATLELADITARMGLPLVSEPAHDLWAVGPDSVGAKALVSAEAPSLVLPDLDGNLFDLASLRDKKVLIYAWAPY